MKIASFNVNGIKARLPALLEWLKESRPCVVALQEIKSTDETFPTTEIEDLGYNLITHGQKSFNGVAILSKYPIGKTRCGLAGDDEDLQSRWVEAEIEGVKICGLYLPNGNPISGSKFDYKIQWMERLYARAKDLVRSEQTCIMLGDFNVIPQKEDAFDAELWVDDALYDYEVRCRFRRIINLGFTDAFRALHPSEQAYTFWDYQGGAWQKNNGIRIDHILLSPLAADRLLSCQIDDYVRGQPRPSDHVPIWIEIENNV